MLEMDKIILGDCFTELAKLPDECPVSDLKCRLFVLVFEILRSIAQDDIVVNSTVVSYSRA